MNDWGAPEAFEFYTTKVANVWQTKVISIPADAEFKVADADWGAVNLGGNGSDIQIAQKYALGSNGNISIKEAFTGIAVLIYMEDTGRYYLALRPQN